MHTITQTPDLAAFCERAAKAQFITVDTEFMRESTYWPKLCLIQIATEDEAVLIDPIAGKLDFAPLLALFDNKDVVKVFHAAKQDIEIFVKMSGRTPNPVFDTQVAAAVCGFGDSVAYNSIVKQVTGGEIDKSSRFTDWSHRPLSEKQQRYALADVTHLRDVYEHLLTELDRQKRHEWVADEMADLMRPELYRVEPEDAWKRLKMKVNKPLELAIMQELAAWRERRAQDQDVPRGRVMKDEAIFELAQQQPADAKAFDRLRSFSRGFGRSDQASEIMSVIAEVKKRDKAELPKVPRRPRGPSPRGPIGDLMRVLLKSVAEDAGVAPRVIASSDDIDALVLDDEADIPAMHGWRKKLFGDRALAIKHGKLALGASPEAVIPIEVDISQPR